MRLSRVENIRAHRLFREALADIEVLEKDRIYCRHGLEHLLDVARIGSIFVLEEGLGIPADVIYAAALLHDLGRAEEYRSGEPHDEAGARIAAEILEDTDYTDEEKKMILAAVSEHRNKTASGGEEGGAESEGELPLADVIRMADRLSRQCWACEAADTCKWPEEKKNKEIKI